MRNVAVVIIIRGQQVLVCQRKRTSRYGLKWEFPGGKMEEGETPEQCAARELDEELGLTAGPVERVETEISHYDDGETYRVHYCYLTTVSGTLTNRVFEEVRWVTRAELPALDHLAGNQGIIRRLTERKDW